MVCWRCKCCLYYMVVCISHICIIYSVYFVASLSVNLWMSKMYKIICLCFIYMYTRTWMVMHLWKWWLDFSWPNVGYIIGSQILPLAHVSFWVPDWWSTFCHHIECEHYVSLKIFGQTEVTIISKPYPSYLHFCSFFIQFWDELADQRLLAVFLLEIWENLMAIVCDQYDNMQGSP